jgi:hypothetical protein
MLRHVCILSNSQLDNMDELTKYHLKHHSDKQIIQAIQECAELIVELTKYDPTSFVTDELLDELFDAGFLIDQMKELFIKKNGNCNRYKRIVNEKLGRELRRHGLVTQ